MPNQDKSSLDNDPELIIRSFKETLFVFSKKIDQIHSYLNNSSDLILKNCDELRRKIQLNTENTVADIKKANTAEEDNLSIGHQIKSIHDHNSKLLSELEKYENELNHNLISKQSKTKEFIDQINNKKKLLKHWLDYIDKVRQVDKSYFLKLNKELTEETALLNCEVNLHIFNSSSMVLIDKCHSDNKPNRLHLQQRDNIYSLNYINLSKIIGLIPSLLNSKCEILENGNYFICKPIQNLKHEMIIYDPKRDEIKLRIDFNKEVKELIKVKDKIVLSCAASVFVIMDEDLNVILEKELKDQRLVGANEDDLYFILKSRHLITYNWSLEKKGEIISFKFGYSLNAMEEPFAIVSGNYISKVELVKDRYIIVSKFDKLVTNHGVRNHYGWIWIMDKNGKRIEYISNDNKCIIDNINELIITCYLNSNSIELRYHDLVNGDLVKHLILEGVPFGYLEHLTIDSKQKIYQFI